jgi:hypothetical protein
MKILTQNHI